MMHWSNTTLRITESEGPQQKRHRRSDPNVQRNESLTKYLLALRILNYVKS